MTVDIDSVRMLTDSIKAATERKPDGSTVSATVTETGSNVTWVRVDGSSGDTPVTQSTVSVSVGDRVSVRIENGSATITGNLSNVSTGAAETRAAVEPVKAVAESAEQAAERATDYASTAKSAAQSAVQSASDAGRAAAVAQAAMGSTTVDWHDYTVQVGEDGQWHVFDKNGAEVPLSVISMVYQDALGLHIIGESTRMDIGDDGLEIVDASDGGSVLASFGADGAMIGGGKDVLQRIDNAELKMLHQATMQGPPEVGVSMRCDRYIANSYVTASGDKYVNIVQYFYVADMPLPTRYVNLDFQPTGTPTVRVVDDSGEHEPSFYMSGNMVVFNGSYSIYNSIVVEYATEADRAQTEYVSKWSLVLGGAKYLNKYARIGSDGIKTDGDVYAGSNYSAYYSAKTDTGINTGFIANRDGMMADLSERSIGYMVGSGGKNAGIWDFNLGKWLIYSNGSTDRTLFHGNKASVDDNGIYSGLKGSAIITESISLFSSVSIAAGSYESGTVNLASRHSGYKPIAVVGQYVNNRYTGFGQAYIDDDDVLHYLVHNNTSSARSTNASLKIMFVR